MICKNIKNNLLFCHAFFKFFPVVRKLRFTESDLSVFTCPSRDSRVFGPRSRSDCEAVSRWPFSALLCFSLSFRHSYLIHLNITFK